MLQLENQTPFNAIVGVLPDRTGADTPFVLLRATFTLDAQPRPSDIQLPPVLVDEYHADASSSSLRYASDWHVGKPATDVVLIGSARAPNERPVSSLLVGLRLAGRSKAAQVFGDRVWTGLGGFSEPQPFTAVPLTWEQAFGGSHRLESGEVLVEERNPVGVGFAGNWSAADRAGAPLPNVEDPAHLLSAFGDRPEPVGFGFLASGWRPRRELAGTYDDAWVRQRAPYLPEDCDPRFFCAAPRDQIFEPRLRGGEPIELVGVHPDGARSLVLPAWELEATARIQGRLEQRALELETVLIEPDAGRLSLTFRAVFPWIKTALRLESIRVDGRSQP